MGNYHKDLQQMLDAGMFPAGGFTQIVVAHDDWCEFMNNRGDCNCKPEFRVLSQSGTSETATTPRSQGDPG